MPFCLRQAIFVAAVSFGFELLRVGKGRPGDCPSLESLKASVDCASLSEVETAVQTGTSTVTGVLGQIESRVDGGGSLASEVPPQQAGALEYWSLFVGAGALGALVWLMQEAGCLEHPLGTEVALEADDPVFGQHALKRIGSDVWHVRLVGHADAPGFSASVVDRYRGLLSSPAPAVVDDEVRTLWVDVDDHGERYKDWRQVVRESSEQSYVDNPLEGPPSLLHLMKHMERQGGNPRRWLQLFFSECKIDKSDRVFHEMTNLVEVVYLGGTYDQLNMPACVCFEKVSRRLQTIIDAYSAGGGTPNWQMARYYDGRAGVGEGVSPSLRTWGLRRAKDEYDVNSMRTRRLQGDGGQCEDNDGQGAGGQGRKGGKGKGGGGRGDGAPAKAT